MTTKNPCGTMPYPPEMNNAQDNTRAVEAIQINSPLCTTESSTTDTSKIRILPMFPKVDLDIRKSKSSGCSPYSTTISSYQQYLYDMSCFLMSSAVVTQIESSSMQQINLILTNCNLYRSNIIAGYRVAANMNVILQSNVAFENQMTDLAISKIETIAQNMVDTITSGNEDPIGARIVSTVSSETSKTSVRAVTARILQTLTTVDYNEQMIRITFTGTNFAYCDIPTTNDFILDIFIEQYCLEAYQSVMLTGDISMLMTQLINNYKMVYTEDYCGLGNETLWNCAFITSDVNFDTYCRVSPADFPEKSVYDCYEAANQPCRELNNGKWQCQEGMSVECQVNSPPDTCKTQSCNSNNLIKASGCSTSGGMRWYWWALIIVIIIVILVIIVGVIKHHEAKEKRQNSIP